jgi:hypothetical protein
LALPHLIADIASPLPVEHRILTEQRDIGLEDPEIKSFVYDLTILDISRKQTDAWFNSSMARASSASSFLAATVIVSVPAMNPSANNPNAAANRSAQ